jgi:hypothetical protein
LELWLSLLVLYTAQCMIRLSRSEVLFVRPAFRWLAAVGPGWRLTHPFDCGAATIAVRLGLTMDRGLLFARDRPARFGLGPPSPMFGPDTGSEFSTTEATAVEQRGHLVRVDGRLFGRCATRSAARALAGLLRDLAGASPHDVKARIRAELDSALSVVDYEREQARLAAATPLLDWLTRGYLLLLFAGLPTAFFFFSEERGLLISLPILAVIHTTTLIAMWRAHRDLFPTERDQRFEDVLTAAFYPPALLRAHANMNLEVLSPFHPAVHAESRFEDEHRRRFLRSELARLDLAIEQHHHSIIASLERESLMAFLKTCGECRESLFAVAPGAGNGACSYCPVCSGEYLLDSGRCTDCGATLIALAEDPTGKPTPNAVPCDPP